MSRITSSVGLITGIPIEDTVTKLMAVAARPRDILKSRNDGLKQQQLALDSLGGRLLSFQFAVNKLKISSVFQTREVASSNPDVLAATLPATGTPTVGSYQVRPVRAASSQQLLSQRFATADEALGSGTLSLALGGFVDQGVSLDELNDGAGVQRGKIRITDRSGASTTIDLSFARSVEDVLEAINSNTDVSVTASTSGDSFTLSDQSGGSGNLRVQDVGSGTTAAGLGLAGVNVAASQATGGDVLRLHAGTKLSTLNDGNGVAISGEGIADLEVTLSDGSELSIDLADATTLGDVIDQINAADAARLSASISSDGRRIELTDLTGGAGDFSVENGAASTAADDLGLVASVSGATISGGRLVAGLRDTLLSSLNGGQGLGELGEITITDRDGGVDPVDLSAAETLGDVIDLINASTAEVTASINAARNGILVADDSGGSGELTIASADATETAEALSIVVDDSVASINSGTLRRQTISEATLLSSLNGGKGVILGDIRVTDSDGVIKFADLNSAGHEVRTVGDVINAINALTNGVEARINDTGDGILLVDTADGNSTLGVADVSGDIARSLNLTRASTTIDIEGAPTQVIDGTATYSIDLDDVDVSNASIPLSSLNAGAGVVIGDVEITDGQGRSIVLDLNGVDAGVTTVGQIIELINDKAAAKPGGFGVTARLNDAGTGIYLEDAGGGTEELTVRDVNGTTAAGLKIDGEASIVSGKQVINGSGAFTANASGGTALEALAARVNELGAGVTASVVFDGIGYRLSLAVDATGDANELLIDAAEAGFQFEEVSQAQDALLLYGNFNSPGAGVLLSSPDGEFAGAIGGVNVTVNAASETPVTVTVKQTDASLVEAFEDLVESYNSLRSDLGKLTSFDAEALTTGLLFGTNEALQIDSRLSRALTDRYAGLGSFESLAQIGLTVTDDGTLELNKDKLQTAFENDPAGLEEFLTNSQNGVAVKLSAVVDRLAGADESLLAVRSDALKNTIEANDDRLEKFAQQLERQQERMFLQFFQLESIIAKLQTSLSAIQNLQVLPPLTSSGS
jgi:flagellar hook-associated protein 2